MMKNKVQEEEAWEHFFIEHRSSLDVVTPPANGWSQLQKKIHTPVVRRIGWWPIMGIAASIVMLVGLGWTLARWQFPTTVPSPQAFLNQSPSLPASVVAAKAAYEAEYAANKMQLQTFDENATIETDLQQLDEVLEELHQELAVAPQNARENILMMMIGNYQTRIQLLNRVMNRRETTRPTSTPVQLISNEKSL